jgi:hypothetical protein
MLVLVLLPLLACTGELPVPEPRRGARAAVGDGQLWVIGGEGAVGLLADVWSYGLEDKQWRRHADAPVAMTWGSVSWDGAAYVVLEGETPSGVSDAAWRLDPRADSWDALAPLPQARSRFGATFQDGTLTLTGGISETGVPYEDAWTLREGIWNLLSADLGVGGFADVTLVGGEGGFYQVGGVLAGADRLYRLEDGLLNAVDDGLGILPAACGMLDDERIWLWDGLEDGETWAWDGEWRAVEVDLVPPARGYAACAQVSDSLYVFGGDPQFGAGGGTFLADLWRLRDGEWKHVVGSDGVPLKE